MLDTNKIYNMDCVDGMKLLDDSCIDLVVTSPPYDNLRSYDEFDGFTFEKFNDVCHELFRVMKDGGVVVWIVNDQSVDGSETGTSFRQALYFKEVGFRLHDTMIWYKDTFSFPEPNKYRQCFEYMFIFSKGKPKTCNLICDRKNKYVGHKIHGTSRGVDGDTFKKPNDMNGTTVSDVGVRFNVWESPTEKNNKTGHPAVFPRKISI